MQYTKPYVPRILLIVLANLSGTLLQVGMALVAKRIIDIATNKGTGMFALVGIYIAGVLVAMLISIGNSLFSIMLSEKFSFGIRKQIYEKIITSQWLDIQRFHTGDLMTRLTSDAASVADGIITVVPDIIRLVLELIVVFFTLFYFSPLLAVFALLLAPLAAFVSFILGRSLKHLQAKVQKSEAAYRSFLQESLANLLVIKAFSNEEEAVQRLTQLRDERFGWVYKKSKKSIAVSSTMSGAFQLGYIAALAYGALLIAKNQITFGTMSLFLTLVNRVQSPIMLVAQNVPKLITMLASAGRIIELQEIPAEEQGTPQLAGGMLGVRLKNVCYGYTDEKILSNFSNDIQPGEFVAIVGESGIGKTTLTRLIMAFMNNYSGQIELYDTQNTSQAPCTATRSYFSYVPQGNTLFSGTIRDNILMGNQQATEAEIETALKAASGFTFVQNLPQKLDTVIGEKGHGLSEGQAQRVAIARALVRRAPVLILDEATSALDEATELEVLKSINALVPRPTCLLITHRRSVLDYCDRAVVID